MQDDVYCALKAIVGSAGVIEGATALAPYVEDWRGRFKGHSPLVLRPSSTKEVSAIIALCHETGTAVVPQGGNTGLVGGQIPVGGEVILCLTRLNAIRSMDRPGEAMVAEAGVVLQSAQDAANAVGMLVPLRMASEGSCTIGGIVSTNAGGVHVVRYGMTRENVLGLEVVLHDGRVLDLLKTLRKDNTGYDLKQLFIGAEGTLGVITAVALKLHPVPVAHVTALLAVPDLKAALSLLALVRGSSVGALEAFEFFSHDGLEAVLRHIPGTRRPFETASPWYVLCELSGGPQLGSATEDMLASALSEELASDAVIAASEAQRSDLWKLRESLSDAEKREGPSLKHDISVPLSELAEFVTATMTELSEKVAGLHIVPFGHLGDGNIHFNILPLPGVSHATFLSQTEAVAHIVHNAVSRRGGSFSAEHGIGIMKRNEMARYKSPLELESMWALKRTFDPTGILNPGKVVPG